MAPLSERNTDPELMDQQSPPEEELRRNFSEIIFINRFTGGHTVSLKGVKRLLPRDQTSIKITDIGCGAGDTLDLLAKHLAEKGYLPTLTGVDPLETPLNIARETFPILGNSFLKEQTYKEYFARMDEKADIIHAAMFCHHLHEAAIIDFLREAVKNSKHGVVINDLHRHPLSYYFILGATKLFSGSEFTRYDAPLSVKKGFIKKDWERLLQKADFKRYELTWEWAFRHLIVLPGERN